jgi:hypothetical protein
VKGFCLKVCLRIWDFVGIGCGYMRFWKFRVFVSWFEILWEVKILEISLKNIWWNSWWNYKEHDKGMEEKDEDFQNQFAKKFIIP